MLEHTIAHRFTRICLAESSVTSIHLPALTRLIESGLIELDIQNTGIYNFNIQEPLDDPHPMLLTGEADALPFINAIRKSTSIKSLGFDANFDDHLHYLFLKACVGHPTLRYLRTCVDPDNGSEWEMMLGLVLGELVAENAPAFAELSLHGSSERVLAPLLIALRSNTHLRALSLDFCITSPLMASGLLASVEASRGSSSRWAPPSLWILSCDGYPGDGIHAPPPDEAQDIQEDAGQIVDGYSDPWDVYHLGWYS